MGGARGCLICPAANKRLDSSSPGRYDEQVKSTDMKTFSLFSFLTLAALFFGPMAATSVAAPKAGLPAEAAESVAPRSGVRFVICSPTGESLPSPLYCQQGKTFRAIRISSRTPSPWVKPEGGVVKFWKEDPGAVAAGEDGKAAKKAVAELPPPFMSVKVPTDMGSKVLCILVPAAEASKTQTYFLNESDFPKSGMHLINFSPYPLQMSLSRKGDFSDKKVDNISFFKRDTGISKENSWSFRGEDGETLSFMLMCKSNKDKPYTRVKASRFVVSGRQSQITVVVKEPSREGVKMLSIQLTEPKPEPAAKK